MMGRLAGKVVLVTGGASGLGAAAARALAAEGARVAITDVQDEHGEGVAGDLPDAVFLRHDVRDEQQWQRVAAGVLSRFCRLDGLVNNAGAVRPGDVETLSYDDFRFQVDVMLGGTFLGDKTAIPHIARAGGSSIVNMASLTGLKGIDAIPPYSAAKGGIIAMTRSVAAHCLDRNYGIRVNATAPGGIETPMLAQFSLGETRAATTASAAAPGRRGTPENVADLIVFLASDASIHINDTTIPIDNGATTR